METVEGIVKTPPEHIEHMPSTRSVLGESMTIEGSTIIPLLSTGFGFGAGGGSGKEMGAKSEGGKVPEVPPPGVPE
jgi:uncharacterized spore protein YtfJ